MAQPQTTGPKLKVFISYSRADMAFADELVEGLDVLGFSVTIDREAILEGEDWKSRLEALIADADTVVFILSPESARSETCVWELEAADRLSKRVLPVLCRRMETTPAPPKVTALNYARFDEGRPFMASLRALGRALAIDADWLHEHTRLLTRAREWENAGRVANRLLSGNDIDAAKTWMARRPKDAPELTELHLDFIRSSEQAEADRMSAELKRLEEIAAAHADRALALEAKGEVQRRLIRVTVGGLIATSLLAIVALGAGAAALISQRAAREAQSSAEATRDDAAEVARIARQEFSSTSDQVIENLDDLLNWAPSSWHGYLYQERAQAYAETGEFATARDNLDRALKLEPTLVPLLITSADTYMITGDSEGAIRDAKKSLENNDKNAVAFGNLWLAEAMQRDYTAAIAHIDEALQKSQRTIVSTETLISPDIEPITRGYKLRVTNTDFLLALRYAKASLFAMMGDDRFDVAMAEADKWDRDYPFSRTAYLSALNWQWLIVRGQAMNDVRESGAQAEAKAKRLPIRDYGVYAAEGALWARVAATRPDFAEHASRAFKRFEDAHRDIGNDRYRMLADWVGRERDRRHAPPDTKAREREALLNKALDLELRAIELSRNASDDSYRLAPAIARISEAIAMLDSNRLGRPLGRREEDLLIDLLLRRGGLRIQDKDDTVKDFGGAPLDARQVIAIDANVSNAHALLARATTDPAEKQAAFEIALKLNPGNSRALGGLVPLLETKNPKAALDYKERERIFREFWASDYSTLARLQAKLDRFTLAREAIDEAISRSPWTTANYEQRHEYQRGANVATLTADLNRVAGYSERAGAFQRSGNDKSALSGYLVAFRLAAGLPEGDANARLALEGVTQDFTRFLTYRFGEEIAMQWWRSVVANPLVSTREKQLAGTEADRLAASRQ